MAENDERPKSGAPSPTGVSSDSHAPTASKAEGLDSAELAELRRALERHDLSKDEASLNQQLDRWESEQWSEDGDLTRWAGALAEDLGSSGGREAPEAEASDSKESPDKISPGSWPSAFPVRLAAAALLLVGLGWTSWQILISRPNQQPSVVRGALGSGVSPAPDAQLSIPPTQFRWEGAERGLSTEETTSFGQLVVLSEQGDIVVEAKTNGLFIDLTAEQTAALEQGRFVWAIEAESGARVGPYWFAVDSGAADPVEESGSE